MPALTQLAAGVFVTTSQFALTNTVLVAGRDGACLLIDPGVLVAEMADLAGQVAARGWRVAAAWSTHPHWDHVLWHAALGTAPRYAAPAAVHAAQPNRAAMAAEVRQEAPGHDPGLLGQLTPVTGGVLDWPGPRAELIVHDGHAPGHGAVFLPGNGVLVAGDMLSDVEIPLLDMQGADPLGDYRAGLSALAAVPAVRHVVPGHGHAGDAGEFRRRVAADHAYLDKVAAGRPFGDPRIDQDWMRAAHAQHLRWRQGEPTGT